MFKHASVQSNQDISRILLLKRHLSWCITYTYVYVCITIQYFIYFSTLTLWHRRLSYIFKIFEDLANKMYVNMIAFFSLQAIYSYQYVTIPMLPVQIRVYRVLPCRNLLSFWFSLKTATSNAKISTWRT